MSEVSNLILTGFMGTGKTVTGRALAHKLGWSFVDLDTRIEKEAGMPIPQIFETQGEVAFRVIERRCAFKVVEKVHQVISTGGGTILDSEIRQHMKNHGLVVCLTASPEAILTRVGKRIEARPLLHGHKDVLGRIRELLLQRQFAYMQANIIIDTNGWSVTEQFDRVWEILKPHFKPETRA